MTETIDELRRRLEAGLEGVTPGPWRVPGNRTPYIVRDAGPWPHDSYGTVQIGECGDWKDTDLARFNLDRWLADAHHIANCSPDNIRLLLDALSALEDEVARLREGLTEIARQRIVEEMDGHEIEAADFQGGFDVCVIRARTVLGEKP